MGSKDSAAGVVGNELGQEPSCSERGAVVNGNDPVSLRFAGDVEGGVVVPEPDFSHLKLPNCATVEIVVDADLVGDEKVRRAMLGRTSRILLPAGTTVVATVSDCVGGAADDRAYAKLVAFTAQGLPTVERWKDLVGVEIRLLENLEVSTRPHGRRRLRSCRCRILYLETDARSLNHALSIIIRHFNPGRISAVGNVFKAVYARVEEDRWCPLDAL